jgi:hypothetical protein
VFVLDTAQTMAPASLPAAGALSAKAAKSSGYTAVGYGTVPNGAGSTRSRSARAASSSVRRSTR